MLAGLKPHLASAVPGLGPVRARTRNCSPFGSLGRAWHDSTIDAAPRTEVGDGRFDRTRVAARVAVPRADARTPLVDPRARAAPRRHVRGAGDAQVRDAADRARRPELHQPPDGRGALRPG